MRGFILTILNHSSATPDGVFDKTCREAAEEKFGFDIEIESCSEDTIVKTRLATGQCPDLLVYNTGSLLYSLHPEEFFMDLTDAPFVENLDEDFIPGGQCGRRVLWDSPRVTIWDAEYIITKNCMKSMVCRYRKPGKNSRKIWMFYRDRESPVWGLL